MKNRKTFLDIFFLEKGFDLVPRAVNEFSFDDEFQRRNIDINIEVRPLFQKRRPLIFL